MLKRNGRGDNRHTENPDIRQEDPEEGESGQGMARWGGPKRKLQRAHEGKKALKHSWVCMKRVQRKGLWPHVQDEVEGRDCHKEPSWQGTSVIQAGGKGSLNWGSAGAWLDSSTKQLEGQALWRGTAAGERAGKHPLASSPTLYSHQTRPRTKRA